MPDWVLPLLLLIGLLAFLYRAFLHGPIAPRSGRDPDDNSNVTNIWPGDGHP